MEDVRVLASHSSTSDERTIAANNIITNYDLHFCAIELLVATANLRNIATIITSTDVLHLSLTTNLRMFYAIMYALLDKDKMPTKYWPCYLINFYLVEGYKLGCTQAHYDSLAPKIYCALHDYYEFDITHLLLSDKLREQIRQHIDSKQSYTKRAIKK